MLRAKVLVVAAGLAMSGSAFAGYANSYNCASPWGNVDNYAVLTDSAGNTIELCTPNSGSGSTTYDLSSVYFITGYSGTTPILAAAYHRAQSIELSAAVGYVVEVDHTPALQRGCGWSLSAPLENETASYSAASCFGPYLSYTDVTLTIEVTHVIY